MKLIPCKLSFLMFRRSARSPWRTSSRPCGRRINDRTINTILMIIMMIMMIIIILMAMQILLIMTIIIMIITLCQAGGMA